MRWKAKERAIGIQAFGNEPDYNSMVMNDRNIAKAYNWYTYFYDTSDAKQFMLDFLKSVKIDKEKLKLAEKLRASDLASIGWNCRILSKGGKLPKTYIIRMWTRFNELLKKIDKTEDPTENSVSVPANDNVIDIRGRIRARASELMGDLNAVIDTFSPTLKFSMTEWLRKNDVKPMIANILADKLRPLYAEIHDAISGKDAQLKEAYADWKKSDLKKYLEFIKGLIGDCEQRTIIAKAMKKPRKKKVKSPEAQIAKLKYAPKHDKYGVSVKATSIIGANQLWVFNVKKRILGVYYAMGPAGLSVKGSKLFGFDPKVSESKKLRKPEDVLPKVLEGGKVVLRKLLPDIKAKAKSLTGRINSDTLLLRVL